MKKILCIIVGMLISISSFAQDFHFIYLRLDNSMSVDLIKQKINEFDPYLKRGDAVLFYSNKQYVMDSEKWDKDELFGRISEQMVSSSDIADDYTIIAETLEDYLALQYQMNRNDEKYIISQKYASLCFHFLVGNTFVHQNARYQDEVLSRALIIGSLKDFNYEINFYPCGANYSSVELNPLYNLNTIIKTK